MDDKERDGHLLYFRQQHLPFAIMAVANQLDDLRSDFLQFKKTMHTIALLTTAQLYRERKLKDVYVDSELWDKLMFLLVGAFNSVLPVDYPFAFVLIKHTEPDRHEPRAVYRSEIPDWRDWVSRGCVPQFEVERNRADAKSEKLHHLKTFLPDGKGGFIDPATDPEGLEPKAPN